tara:strand:- start:219 stop:1892 length:1674 start_codon:yes stop_codon:yes gene_type:complete
MPTTPTVFRPIRSNDYQRRAFKAYKNYRITSTAFATSSGYIHHNAIYHTLPINVGHDAEVYPINSLDNTNQHVIWHSLNHRYYQHPYNPVRSSELTDASKTSKNLYRSASCLIAPYFEVGDRIKPGSVTGTFTNGHVYNLIDDGNGNLLDIGINSSSFASSSRDIFHLSFNKEFNPSIPNKSNVTIVDGVTTTGEILTSGLAAKFDSINSRIRIPHDNKFNKFNYYDDWTISFWSKITPTETVTHFPLISKGGIVPKTQLNQKDSNFIIKDTISSMPSITGSYNNHQSPFIIGFESNNKSGSWHFQSSNGSSALHISSSLSNYKLSNVDWKHIAIRNSGSLCQMFIDNNLIGTTSGSIPNDITSNRSDIIIGSFIQGGMVSPNSELAEIRMYDYAVNNTGLTSLSNRHYLSGSLYQTNIAGNIFYRSGELVVSSPMPKYNTGSGAFGNTFNVKYKGTHTIYENEVFIRVPKDQFNVSINPSATYTPGTNNDLTVANQSNALVGDHRKTIFTSGIANPYITSIGLYNDKAQLIAVSKLAQPIQKRDDIDMNFVVRWDY